MKNTTFKPNLSNCHRIPLISDICWNGPSGPGLNDLVAYGLGRSGVDPAVKTKTNLILILDFTIFKYEKVGVLSAVQPL